MPNLTSELIVKLVDDVSGPAKKIAAALQAAEQQAKALGAAGTGRLADQLSKFGLSASQIEKVSAAWKNYSSTQGLAANASNWTTKQASQVRAWESTTVSSIKAVINSERLLARQQELVAASAIRAQRSAAAQRSGGGFRNFMTKGEMRGGGMLGLMAGPALLHGMKVGLTSGAILQSEVVKMRAAGIPEADIERVTDRSMGLAAKYPNVKRSDVLERFKELRSIMLHPEEAHELLETVIKANSALNAVDRTGKMAEGLQFAIKGAEVLGRAQDPKRFAAYLDSFVKARQVMGDTISPETMYDLATNLKASGAGLSDRFLSTTALSLAQEMRGARAGVGTDQFIKQVVGGFQGSQHAAAKEFVAYGLANKSDFETTKTGAIKGMKTGHHVAGHELAASDPDLWVYKYLLPAFEKKGLTTQAAQINQVRRMFTSTRSADIVSKLITQRLSFENHAKLYGYAMGMDAAIGTNRQDALVGLNSLTTMLGSFAGTLTSPMMKDAASVMTDMALGIGSVGVGVARWQKNNPRTAEAVAVGGSAVGLGVATYLTMGLINSFRGGFGLKVSAVALDGSAAALTRAAVALGGGKVLDGLPAGTVKKGSRAVKFLKRGLKVAGPIAVAAAAAEILYDNLPDDIKKEAEKRGAAIDAGKPIGMTKREILRKAYNDERAAMGLPLIGDTSSIPMPRPRPAMGLPPIGADGDHPSIPLPRPRPGVEPPAAIGLPPIGADGGPPFVPLLRPRPPEIGGTVSPTIDAGPAESFLKTLQKIEQYLLRIGTGEGAQPVVDTSEIDAAQTKVDALKRSLLDLGGMTVRPGVEPRIESVPHIGGIGHASLISPSRGAYSEVDNT